MSKRDEYLESQSVPCFVDSSGHAVHTEDCPGAHTTEKMKHTSGPWHSEPARAFDFSGKEFCTRIYADDPGPERDFTIAIVREADPELRAVHARLIAASPEMLSALEWIANQAPEGPYDIAATLQESRRLAQAAIRRAKGE